MAYDTRELAVKIVGDASDFVKATGDVSDSSKQASTKLDDFASGAKKASVVLAGAGVGLTAYAKSATDYTTGLVSSSKELARQTGVTVEQASQYVYVAQRMGVSADQAATVFGTFSKRIQSATDDAKNASQAQAELQNKIDSTKLQITGITAEIQKNGDTTGELTLKLRALNTDLSSLQTQMGQSQNSFQKLGISVVDAQGNTKDFNTLLLDTADKFKAMKDGSEKTTLAMDLFGRAGKDMIPILNQGSQGIQDLEAQADKLGLTLNATTIDAVSKYIKAQKDLKDSTNALKLQVGTLTTPVLTNFDNQLNNITKQLLSVHGPMHTAVVDVLAFGGPVAGAAGGLANFAGNLASAGPLFSKFGGLMNPWSLAIGAAAIGVTILGVKFAESVDKSNHLGQAFDDQQAKLTGLNAHYGSSVTLLQIFQDRQKMAEDAVTAATNEHKAALDAIAPSQDAAKAKADALTIAQANVKQALDTFGQNSPQYQTATENLSNAEYAYNQQLLSNWGLEVNVTTSADSLANARSNLAATTSDLNRIQDILNKGLDASVSTIAKFGPVASQQMKSIDNLQNHLSLVVTTFNGFSASVQAEVPHMSQLLGGVGNALQIYQGQAASLNTAIAGAASNSSTVLQNAGAQLQAGHNAGGTDNWRGGLTWVGEKGPELVNLPKGSQVLPNNKSMQLAQGGGSSTSLTFNVNVGMYAGMPVEKRQIALEMYRELVRAARAQGVQMPMIGAVGVQ